MDELTNGGPVGWMRSMLAEWLQQTHWEPQQMIDWLQGYKLPPVGHDDEPFLWLLRGLPVADELCSAKRELATRAAKVLADKPDETRPGTRPDEVLYNLFMLCAGLSCPDQLADPLYEVFQRRFLKGKWLGVDVRDALQSALISNQLDNRLQPVWEIMAEKGEHDFLPGDYYDGFDGIILMPEAADKRGEPALDAIGKALKAMSKHLEQEHDRRPRFRLLLERVLNTYPGRPTWNIDLVMRAHKKRWNAWAVECLPSLYISCGSVPQGRESAVVWCQILDCVPVGYDYEITEELCNGLVKQVNVTGATVKLIESIAPTFERNRVNNPFPSDRSTWGIVIASIIEASIDTTRSPIGEKLRDVVGRLEGLQEIMRPVALRLPDTWRQSVSQLAKDVGCSDDVVTRLESMKIAA
jgi:hypothetical protein